jgi:hypothetical protein
MIRQTLLIIILAFAATTSYSQDSLRVLFLGNSYTSFNNLPGITASLAEATGNYLQTTANTPGGYTLDGHSTNSTSLDLIMLGGWDYVVLQEQSQIPTIDIMNEYYFIPGATSLKETIYEYNPCANIVMYMTWGRQNGGQQCTTDGVYCSVDFTDFSHMTDTLASRYESLAEQIGAKVAPVGKAWDHALTYSITDPALVLHSGDQSHPNYSGSYLAACVFHGLFWNTSPVGNTFTGSLNESEASYLQESAHLTLSDYHQINTSNTSSVFGAYGSEFGTDCNLSTSGNDLVFNPTSTYNYTWLDDEGNVVAEGVSLNTYTASESGDYTVVVLNKAGCESQCNGYIEVSSIIESQEKGWEWTDDRTLSTTQIQTYSLKLFNSSGMLIHSEEGNSSSIEIPKIQSGIYLVSIIDQTTSKPQVIKFQR